MIQVAINGLGRIGRAVLKIALEKDDLMIAAVNDLASVENLAYLLKHDSVYGTYGKEINVRDGSLMVEGKTIRVIHEKDPARLPWKDLGAGLVFECTGKFTRKEDMRKHLEAGAVVVILSAPSKNGEVETLVHGVNRAEGLNQGMISCASCTTNCVAPVMEIMARRIGVKKAAMTTIHAYTSTQSLVDSPNKKWARGRAAGINYIPATTGAAGAVIKSLPQFEGKFQAAAIRGPVACGSVADMVFLTERSTTIDEINQIFREESQSERYLGIVGASDEPLVSSDIIKDSRASVVDLSQTQVVDGDLVKVFSWYDNEWGYANQLIREAERLAEQSEMFTVY